MKKNLLILSLVAMMFISIIPVSAETTAGQDYWNEMKKIYEEWQGIESQMTMEMELAFPGLVEETVSIKATGISDMEEFDSYMQIHVETSDPEMVIPTIELYIQGADIYLNQEFVLFLADMTGMGESVTIEEDFVMLQDNQTDFQLDSGFLVQILEFMEGMNLDFELDMTFEDETYHLSMDADDMIDLLSAYIVYALTNMEDMAMMMGMPSEDLELSDEELAELMAMYEVYVAPMLEEARTAIAGSTYEQSTVFEDDSYHEVATLLLKTPDGNMNLTMESSALKLETPEISLPTSVKVVTEEDLAMLMLGGMETTVTNETSVVAVFEVDADLVYHFDHYDVSEHEANMTISTDGRSSIPTSLASELFQLDTVPDEETMAIKSLEDYGYTIEWDETSRVIMVSLETIY